MSGLPSQDKKASAPILTDILVALEMVVMERRAEGVFSIIGDRPAWFTHLCPNAITEPDRARPGDQFPFLENFLVEAEDFWRERRVGRLKSGSWSEADPAGREYHLEASALCLGETQVLLLESLGQGYEETHAMLQKARENLLAHERLTKEIQKKEILLHCIVHDLAGPLMGINGCFSFLDPAKLGDREKQFLEVGVRSAQKLDHLIQEILQAFSAEIAALEAFTVDPDQAPDAALCAREVVNALGPAFALNQVSLQLKPHLDLTRAWKVAGEKSRLERVISNLVENALRYSPPRTAVTVSLADEAGQILITIDDQGPGLPPEAATTLFQKFAQGKSKRSGKVGLGLYFCRITVEHWGGAIGYAPRPEGGSRFWFRLPKPETK